jgi:hypothetical protein
MTKEKLSKSPVDDQKRNDDWNAVHAQLQNVQKKSNLIQRTADESAESFRGFKTSFNVGFASGSVAVNPTKLPSLLNLGNTIAGLGGVTVNITGGSKSIALIDGSGAMQAVNRAAAVQAGLGILAALNPTANDVNAKLALPNPKPEDFEFLGHKGNFVSVEIISNTEIRDRVINQIQNQANGLETYT